MRSCYAVHSFSLAICRFEDCGHGRHLLREAVTSAANTSTCAWLLLSSIHIFKSDTTLRVDVAVVAVVVCKYASGYISRALCIKLQKSAEPLKDQLILCLLDLLDDGEDEHVESHKWILNMDRVGLCHVNNTIILLIISGMELESRRRIQNDPTPIFLEVQSLLMHNEDVLFNWSIIGCDWEEEESGALLLMVVTY